MAVLQITLVVFDENTGEESREHASYYDLGFDPEELANDVRHSARSLRDLWREEHRE